MDNITIENDSIQEEKGVQAPLGIHTKSCNPPYDYKAAKQKRWELQSMSAQYIPDFRVAGCYRWVNHKSYEYVDIVKSANDFTYRNLQICGSVWTCPICAARITEHRRKELELAVKEWRDKGRYVLLLTQTVPHYAHQNLKYVLDCLALARRKMLNRKAWKRLAKILCLKGEIRGLEVTYGENGWHPHFHILLFLDEPPFGKLSLKSIEKEILRQWKSACDSSGLPEPNKHGISIDDGKKIDKYLGKWGIEYELTKGHVKKGKKGGLTPFDLLRYGFETNDPLYELLFQEFAYAFKGKRQLVYTKGLKKLLKIDEISDQEIAEQEEHEETLFARIHLDVWRHVVRHNKRFEVLEICNQGLYALAKYLSDLSGRPPDKILLNIFLD